MATAVGPALSFGQALFTGLVQTGTLGPSAAVAQAVLSPVSVYFALLLLLNGAGPLSQTQKELWAAVGPPLPSGSSPTALAAAAASFNNATAVLQKRLKAQAGAGTQLVIANAIWTQNAALKPAYVQQMKSLYEAQVQSVSSAAPINAWAAAATNGLITNVVPPNTKFNVLLTNAVYFKGQWEYPFSAGSTRKQSFNALGSGGASRAVQADMMSRTFKPRELRGSQPIRYGEKPNEWRAIRLPYKGSAGLAAVAVLPDKGVRDVYAAAAAFTPDQLFDRSGKLWASLFDVGTLEVALPRFKVSVSQLSLTKALQSLGIKAAFNPKQADFSGMSDDNLVVSDVLQSAVVQVDESGTEAAAVTSVVMVTTAFTPNATPPLVFNRPFLFYLVDDVTQTVLFQGVVTDPTK